MAAIAPTCALEMQAADAHPARRLGVSSCAVPSAEALGLRLALDLRLGLVVSPGQGLFEEDVSDVFKPFLRIGSGLGDVERILCGVGLVRLSRFSGGTSPDEIVLVAKKTLSDAPSSPVLVVKLVLTKSASGPRLKRCYAYLRAAAAS